MEEKVKELKDTLREVQQTKDLLSEVKSKVRYEVTSENPSCSVVLFYFGNKT